LVTAAASGLARGCATALARAGYRIAVTTKPGGTPADDVLAHVRAHDPDACAYVADVSEPGMASDVVSRIVAAQGPVDVLVHALGPIVVKRFAQCTEADHRAMIEGNFSSSVALAFALLPGMRERAFGRLVFFGMNGSHVTQPARGMALYGAAKAAVVTFARTLALEEARYGITANVIEPGDIRDKSADRSTARARPGENPTGHAGSWEDIAEAVLFAVSDNASFLNGMVIGVNGGLVEPFEGYGSAPR
jgi:3-oxoacyl-[acyl-carrier protein] reductase